MPQAMARGSRPGWAAETSGAAAAPPVVRIRKPMMQFSFDAAVRHERSRKKSLSQLWFYLAHLLILL